MASQRSHETDTAAFGLAVAGIAPIAVAAALVAVRDEVAAANLALVLVVVVVLAAMLGGRAAGALAAVMSALSFNFFLTKPYLTLQVDSADDVETMLILLVIGLLVGELVTLTRRAKVRAERGADEVARIHRLAELAAAGAEVDDVVLAAEAELTGLLDLAGCYFDTEPSDPALPILERNGAVTGAGPTRRFVGGEFALPGEGIQLPVLGRGSQVGRLVLTPGPKAGASLEERVVAVALSDQLGSVIAASATAEHRKPDDTTQRRGTKEA